MTLTDFVVVHSYCRAVNVQLVLTRCDTPQVPGGWLRCPILIQRARAAYAYTALLYSSVRMMRTVCLMGQSLDHNDGFMQRLRSSQEEGGPRRDIYWGKSGNAESLCILEWTECYAFLEEWVRPDTRGTCWHIFQRVGVPEGRA